MNAAETEQALGAVGKAEAADAFVTGLILGAGVGAAAAILGSNG